VVGETGFDPANPYGYKPESPMVQHGSYSTFLQGRGIYNSSGSGPSYRSIIYGPDGNPVRNATTGEPIISGKPNDWNVLTEALKPFEMTPHLADALSSSKREW
jgi:hypothetical protein